MSFREFYQRRHGEGQSERQWYGWNGEPYDEIFGRLANALADYADAMVRQAQERQRADTASMLPERPTIDIAEALKGGGIDCESAPQPSHSQHAKLSIDN